MTPDDFTFTPTDELRSVLSTLKAPVTLTSILDRWGVAPLGELIEAKEAALTLLENRRYAVRWTGKLPEPTMDDTLLRDRVRELKQQGRTVKQMSERLKVEAGIIRAILQGMRRDNRRIVYEETPHA